MAVGNAIGEQTTGICGFTGTAFTGSPVTQHLVQIGGATSSTLAEVAIGTSGQVLTSNGAGLAPTFQTVTAGGGVLTVNGQLTSAQIKAIHGTPVQIVANPGANNMIVLMNLTTAFVYGGTNVFVAGAGQTINLYFDTATDFGAAVSNAVIVSSTNTVRTASNFAISDQARANYVNRALNWYNPVVTEISGNAANNNVINYSLTYRIVSL